MAQSITDEDRSAAIEILNQRRRAVEGPLYEHLKRKFPLAVLALLEIGAFLPRDANKIEDEIEEFGHLDGIPKDGDEIFPLLESVRKITSALTFGSLGSRAEVTGRLLSDYIRKIDTCLRSLDEVIKNLQTDYLERADGGLARIRRLCREADDLLVTAGVLDGRGQITLGQAARRWWYSKKYDP